MFEVHAGTDEAPRLECEALVAASIRLGKAGCGEIVLRVVYEGDDAPVLGLLMEMSCRNLGYCAKKLAGAAACNPRMKRYSR